MELETRAFQLIDRIYAGASEPDRWQDFVDDLSEALDGAHVGFGLNAPQDPQFGTAYLVGITPEYRRSFTEHLVAGLPFAAHFGPETSKRTIVLSELFPELELAETSFYREWMRPQGMAPHWPIGGSVYLDGTTPAGWFYAWRLEGAPPFAACDLALCDLLLPHLHRAIRLHLSLASSQQDGLALGQVVDRLPTGVILLDAQGQVVSKNRSADAILSQDDGFSIGPAGPHARKPRDDQALKRAVANAANAPQGSSLHSSGFTAIDRPSGRRPFVVMATPLLAATPGGQGGDAVVALFIADPDAGQVSATEVLESLYQLTHAEADLVRLLAAGHSLEESARLRGVTMNTARGQLKHVFAKTDTRRQGELVRLVLTGVGTLRDSG